MQKCFLLLKHTVTVATAVGNYAYRKSVKQMLHRCHMAIINLVTSTNYFLSCYLHTSTLKRVLIGILEIMEASRYTNRKHFLPGCCKWHCDFGSFLSCVSSIPIASWNGFIYFSVAKLNSISNFNLKDFLLNKFIILVETKKGILQQKESCR